MKKQTKYLIYAIVIITAIILIYFLQKYQVMHYFMGGFFIAVSILKMLDWKGFVHAYSMYDIIAKKSKYYAYAYPLIEFCLGLGFLFGNIRIAAIITLIIMIIGIIGIAKNLLSPQKVRCACLGTLIKIPLTEFTLFEDAIMAVMAFIMFFF